MACGGIRRAPVRISTSSSCKKSGSCGSAKKSCAGGSCNKKPGYGQGKPGGPPMDPKQLIVGLIQAIIQMLGGQGGNQAY